MQKPPIDFLFICSGTSLMDFELNRLNQAANLRKHISEMEGELRRVEAEALLARWLMEYRDALLTAGRQDSILQRSFEFTAAPPMLPPLQSPALERRAAGKKPSRDSRKEICA